MDNEKLVDLTHSKESGGIFVPTIRYYKGIFYVIFTNIEQGTFIVSTTDIHKPFDHLISIDIHGIDPSLFFEDNKTYVTYACFGKIMKVMISGENKMYIDHSCDKFSTFIQKELVEFVTQM